MHIAGPADQVRNGPAAQAEKEHKDFSWQDSVFPVVFHGFCINRIFTHPGAHPAFCAVRPWAGRIEYFPDQDIRQIFKAVGIVFIFKDREHTALF